MEKSELHRRIVTAEKALREVSSFLLSHESLRSDITAKGKNDYVTAADSAAERLIREIITSAFPGDHILGEEYGGEERRCERWIIDPIDGTVDFMSSFPCYTISIAFEDECGLALGAIAVPRQGEVFTAIRGEGAFLNGSPIHTDERADLSESLAILVPPHRNHARMDKYLAEMRRLYDVLSDMRSLGSAALSLCYVACGRVAAYYELGLHIYDCAAGIVIAKEAGGKITLLSDDDSCMDIVASSTASHERVLEAISG